MKKLIIILIILLFPLFSIALSSINLFDDTINTNTLCEGDLFCHKNMSDDIVLYSSFDIYNNNTVYDWTHNNYDGTNTGYTYETSPFEGYSIEAANSADRINYGDVPYFDGNVNFSIAFWSKIEGASIGDCSVIEKWGGLGNAAFIIWQDVSASYGHVKWTIQTHDGAATRTIDGTNDVPGTGTWRHLVVTFEDTNVTLYSDGNYDVSSLLSKPMDSSTDLKFTSYRGNRVWYGEIDEFIVFDKILTPNEVQEIYNFSYPKFKSNTVLKNSFTNNGSGSIGVTINCTDNFQNQTNISVAIEEDGIIGSYINVTCDNEFNLTITADEKIKNITKLYNSNGYWSPVEYNYTTISLYPATTCNCPTSGDWYIADGSFCTLTDSCTVNGLLNIVNGTLALSNTAKISANGCSIDPILGGIAIEPGSSFDCS